MSEEFKPLKIRVEKAGKEEVTIFLTGHLSENSDFNSLNVDSAQTLIFDLEDVRLVNSSGLRNWLMFIRSLSEGVKVVLRHCQSMVVEQMNILEGFLPETGYVESVYVPYYCEKCDATRSKLLKRGEAFQEATEDKEHFFTISETDTCEQCGGAMSLDILPKHHFRFLKGRVKQSQ